MIKRADEREKVDTYYYYFEDLSTLEFHGFKELFWYSQNRNPRCESEIIDFQSVIKTFIENSKKAGKIIDFRCEVEKFINSYHVTKMIVEIKIQYFGVEVPLIVKLCLNKDCRLSFRGSFTPQRVDIPSYKLQQMRIDKQIPDDKLSMEEINDLDYDAELHNLRVDWMDENPIYEIFGAIDGSNNAALINYTRKYTEFLSSPYLKTFLTRKQKRYIPQKSVW